MTLATTCPQCKTSFKVVSDQLKLRRGMVRCGVCQHVFNGLEHLRLVENPKTKAAAASPPKEPVAAPAPPASTIEMAAQRATFAPILALRDQTQSM